jgi:hypothetical protein
MNIYRKDERNLTFECRHKRAETWIRFDRDKKGRVQVDKVAMCCEVRLTKKDQRELIDWLNGKINRICR